MRYRSKPTECEAHQWNGQPEFMGGAVQGAEDIVAWVNANGGEARYEPEWVWSGVGTRYSHPTRIAIRTINGWAYAAPGDYSVMGSAVFKCCHEPGCSQTLRDFYPCDPETFEKRWESIK